MRAAPMLEPDIPVRPGARGQARGVPITTDQPGAAAPTGRTEADPPWMRGLHTDAGYLLYRLGLRAGRLFNAQLAAFGLRLRHYALVRYLATVSGALQRELSERLGYDPSAIVALVDDLERLGLVERRPSPDDRRSRIVVLTDGGRELLRRSEESSHLVTDALLAPLDPQERATLRSLLRRIADADHG